MKRPITPRGYNALRTELQKLKAMRPELARAIEVARGHGDLSENGDYDAAKEKSGMTEAKIRDIEAKLSMADIIDPRKLSNPQKVVFGVSVRIEDVNSGEARTLAIVGADESDADRGWISIESPLGRGSSVRSRVMSREFSSRRGFANTRLPRSSSSTSKSKR